jgi:hypothetical protein
MDESMNTRLALFLVLVSTSFGIPSAHAQRRMPSGFRPSGGLLGRTARRWHRAGAFFNSGFLSYPFFYDQYEPEVIQAPPTQINVVQTPAPIAEPTKTASEASVLELRGDRWVRITNNGQAITQPNVLDSVTESPTGGSAPEEKLPPAVLVFRDGHHEEIERYTITGGAIYTKADYWITGSWTRKIQINELDVPATLATNRDRGTKFRLPSGPNEIVIRP